MMQLVSYLRRICTDPVSWRECWWLHHENFLTWSHDSVQMPLPPPKLCVRNWEWYFRVCMSSAIYIGTIERAGDILLSRDVFLNWQAFFSLCTIGHSVCGELYIYPHTCTHSLSAHPSHVGQWKATHPTPPYPAQNHSLPSQTGLSHNSPQLPTGK